MVSNWKNISIKKIAKASGFGTATVDRVLNKRDGVSEKSKKAIYLTLENLIKNPLKKEIKKILICCESGPSYNKTLETVINNKTGFLIPLNDQASMTSCIIELLSSSELIEKFGINGYNTVKNNFSLNEMLRKHRNYLANL